MSDAMSTGGPIVAVAHEPWRRHPGESPYWEPGFVDRLIARALTDFGLGRGKGARQAPLRDIIEPGMTVLLKPNFVLHYNKSGSGMDCMITHPGFILAVLAQVVRAKPGRVLIGDAPVQGCDFDQIVEPWFVEAAQKICGQIPLAFVDFRRTITTGQDFVHGVREELRSSDAYVIFDLGRDSLLEPLSGRLARFRVTQYDPRKLARTHRPHRHQYLIARELFAADVVLNLPKLKTHKKGGITGTLKNLVGINGNKDFLPHHRFGGATLGGDCYPGAAPFKLAAEVCLDLANMSIGRPRTAMLRGLSRRLADWNLRWGDRDPNLEGSWHGNDTVWRMVLDLNRILGYGRDDGSMADAPQRRVWHLTDAIVCGEHNGPLAPEPRYVGAVTFSDSAPEAERAHASLLRFDARHVPLLREAFGTFRWPLVTPGAGVELRLNGVSVTFEQLARDIGVDAVPPDGWRGRIELAGHHRGASGRHAA